MNITSRSTKAEILAAYQELKQAKTTWQDVLEFTNRTAATISRETRLLVIDLIRLGRTARSWYDLMVDEFSQPLLRSKARS